MRGRDLFGLVWPGLVMACMIALSACSPPSEVDVPLTYAPSEATTTPFSSPSPEPPPPKTLIVCLNREPDSLYIYDPAYLYGDTGLEANAVLAAIYDGPIDLVSYQPQPVILERLPNLARGEDARLEEVGVREGELYFNPITLQPERLQSGKSYIPSGCLGTDCMRPYEGGQVFMPRLVVEFHILPGLSWSDGAPLTAADSVFSFELDRNAETRTLKYLVDRTTSYEALEDGLSVRWSGIPGFLDAEYKTNFWTPLPRHVLASLPPAALVTSEAATRLNLGWGPYMIDRWDEGDQIVLSKNPYYSPAQSPLPAFDVLIYRFIGPNTDGAIQQLLTGECDVLDESLIYEDSLEMLLDFDQAGDLRVISGAGAQILRMDFNLAPVGATFEPGLFADIRTRQAIASCIDRDRIAATLFSGLGTAVDSYLSPSHPAYNPVLAEISYDVAAANALLDEIGWQDDDDDPLTPRVAFGVPRVAFGTPLSITYTTVASGTQEQLAEMLRSDLTQCGIELNPVFEDVDDFKAEFPDGVIFGRGFQTVGWVWPDWWIPLCDMFAGREIPNSVYPFGSNASGFDDPAYNGACDAVLLGLPETPEYLEAIDTTQEIFAAQLPAIPLLQVPRMIVTRAELCGVQVDPLVYSLLWNVEAFDAGEGCVE